MLDAPDRTTSPRVITATGAIKMTGPDQILCRCCGEPIANPRRGQKFYCDRHGYLWHQSQRISAAKLEEKIRAIVRTNYNRPWKRIGAGRYSNPASLS